MNDVRIRELREYDVPEASAVFLTTLGDLARRNGLPSPAWSPAAVEPLFDHLRRTGDFRVAEQDGRITSICAAVVRGNTWFLSLFWTLPELQRTGVGGPLLKAVWRDGQARGPACAFTWSSIDAAAICSYMKLGMLPRCQIFTFSGPVSQIPEVAGGELSPASPETIRRHDQAMRGVDRDVDHAFWKAGGAAGFEVRRGGNVVGWFTLHDGVIGPAGWSDPVDGELVLALALREAADRAASVRLMAIGTNHDAIRAALGAGLQLVSTAHLLASGPLGAIERYLPSGPALF